ncbi:MAG: zinc ABC transporter substrate-binding protein [Chlamydiia bacterium]|nr:zinc ABC transporter substrate-binding protein [Chlamydiia bacterium]
MKRIIALFLTPFLFLGCQKREVSSFMEENGKINVLSTTAMIDDLVGFIGGEEVNHLSLIVGDLDPHSYELVKGDDEKFSRAHVIFSNGLGLEHGASLSYQLKRHPHALALGDLVYAASPERFIYYEGELDPHFWMDVALFSECIDPIVSALSKQDLTHASLFAERGEELKRKMAQKDRELLQTMHAVPSEKRFLVSSHDAFFYFAKKYLAEPEEKGWVNRFMAPEGLAPDGQMSLRDIQKVATFLCEHEIHVVFPETNVNQDALRKIIAVCREKGHPVRIVETPLFGDTMGEKGTGASTYLKMIEHNVTVLKQELPQKAP